MEVIFLDTETNGFSNCSVLSLCAIKCEIYRNKTTFNINRKDAFVRYYFPKESFNSNAIDVNGLSYDAIEAKRCGNNWPRYFNEDFDAFLNFVSDCDHLVCHNVEFDRRFLPFSFSNEFCTMRSFSSHYKNNFQLNKNPKLSELVHLFQIDTNLMSGRYHEAEYDVDCLIEIFKSGYNINQLKSSINSFLDMPARNGLQTRKTNRDCGMREQKSTMTATEEDNDHLKNILLSFDKDLFSNKLTPFPRNKLPNLAKHFSKKSSMIIRNVNNCCCDDCCKEKEIQPLMDPKVEKLKSEYKIFGNRSEDVFPLIVEIYKKHGKDKTRTYIVGEYLYSLNHRFLIPNGKVPVKIGKTRVKLDLNHETYIIYPNRQSKNFYYLVEVI